MPKFVSFDDGFGTYDWKAVFPSTATNAEIKKAIERKLIRNLRSRGYGKEDMPTKVEMRDWTTIIGMKEGQFYEPEYLLRWF